MVLADTRLVGSRGIYAFMPSPRYSLVGQTIFFIYIQFLLRSTICCNCKSFNFIVIITVLDGLSNKFVMKVKKDFVEVSYIFFKRNASKIRVPNTHRHTHASNLTDTHTLQI